MIAITRIRRLAGAICATIALTCLCGCLTRTVADYGRFSEFPDKVVRVTVDYMTGDVTIDYTATVYAPSEGTRGPQPRQLRIPSGRLASFRQSTLDKNLPTPRRIPRRGVWRDWWRDDPDFVLPAEIWAPFEHDIGLPGNARQLRITPLSGRASDADEEAAMRALLRGEAVTEGNCVWLLRGRHILSIRLPSREATTPKARLTKPLLYPLAVAGDILLLPVTVPLGLAFYLFFPRI